MANRLHTSPNIKIHQSTGSHTAQQVRRTHTQAAAEGESTPGHHKHIVINEYQRITISGTPTGGTFTLTFGALTTGAIAYNATQDVVQAALEALATIAVGDVEVVGPVLPDGYMDVKFQGDYEAEDPVEMTATSAGLTGGTTPTASVATIQPGFNGAKNAFSGGLDDRPELTYYEDEAPKVQVGTSNDRLVVTGTITPPVDPSGSEQGTRKYWRGYAKFGQRIALN